MIDWHSHILPGVDDGPAEIGQSLVMATGLAAAGFSTVYCTPHLMRGCYEVGNDEVRRVVAVLQEQLIAHHIPLTLQPGREYCLDEYLLDALKDPLPLGNSRLILVELLPHLTDELVRRLLYGVVRSGFTPVIAHPERCPLLEPVVGRRKSRGFLGTCKSLLTGGRNGRQEPDLHDSSGNLLLDYLRELGCCFQGNLGSFNGFYGVRVRAAAEGLKCLGVYDRYGSDLHAPEHIGIILNGSHSL